MADGTGEFGRMLAENARYTDSFDRSELTAAPLRAWPSSPAWMRGSTSREALGLRTGDAHIIRNAGGTATDDAIRSLIISQQLLGTDEIVVIGHTGCGLLGIDEASLRDRLADETGQHLDLAFGSFDDLEASVRASVARLRAHPWITPVPVHGLIFDVSTGRLRELT